MTFLSNIQSVAKYESKLLIRSWFFRVFTVLAVTIITKKLVLPGVYSARHRYHYSF